MRTSSRRQAVPKHQADAYVDQSSPVSGTKYEWSTDGTQTNKLGALTNIRLLSIYVECTWTVQPSPLEIHVTIDGQVITHTVANPVSTTTYCAVILSTTAETAQKLDSNTDKAAYQQPIYEGRKVKVECEVTGGTVSNLKMRVKYAKW